MTKPRSNRKKQGNLARQIGVATGPDPSLDALIAETLAPPPEGDAAGRDRFDRPRAYTASVDDCLKLIAQVLPAWHWHIGHGPDGVLPYATLSRAPFPHHRGEARAEASAPTVPLALLRAAMQALAEERQ